jgi:aerobic-type carbon monoxide dehydrogenase small subunit (CoxS/CutS family)
MIVKASELLTRVANPTEAQIRYHMDGHLCRCGTYQLIVQAIKRAATVMAEAK